jgi:hypothetical protein
MPKPMIERTPGTELEITPPVTFAAEQWSPISAAARYGFNDSLWNSYRFTNTTWQRDAWRFYHCIPELHFAADYMGAACSRVRVFIEKLDNYGRPSGEVTDDDQIAAIAETLFGGPSQRAQALNAIGTNLTIAGECFVVGRSRRDFTSDKWFVVSTTGLKRRSGQITINFGYGPEQILSDSDLVVRLWKPDPERLMWADSPTYACLNVLQELEELMLYEFSQIDSRLSGAGMYPLPAEMSNGPSDSAEIPQSATDVFNLMAQAGKAARSGRGVAAGTTPVFFEVPGEFLKDLKDSPIRFDSELSDRMKDYKEGALKRLATGMNMPSELLLGMGDVNHISVWSIEESFIKIHVEPMMNLICEGLTTAYLRPLLKTMGKDGTKYQLSFDTAPLTVRASRLQDTLNLYEKGLVKAETVLIAGNYNVLTDTPTEEESTERFVRELMLRDPTLISVPPLVEAANLDIDMPEQVLAVPGDPNAPGPPPPPAPQRSVDNQPRPVDPRSTDSGPTRPASNQGTPILASAVLNSSPDAVLAAANVVVRRALEIAGGRLLNRTHRGQFPDVAKFEIHTKIKVTRAQAEEALAGAFDHLVLDFAGLGVDTTQMKDRLHRYCLITMSSNMAHDPATLAKVLNASAG